MSSQSASSRTALAALTGHALCLDVDGTLLDIAPSPDSVEVPPWMVPLLEELHRRLEGAVAFVSGRPIGDIDRLFAPLTLPAIGVHGGEFRMLGGPITREEEFAGELAAVKPFLRRSIQPLRGVLLEDKHSVIALHYRKAPEFGREVLRIAELALARMGGDFAVLVGKCVVEIRPRYLTKGIALQRLMETPPFRGRTPIFAGDDVSDEDAFEVVNRLGGISVRVGDPARTAATCHLTDPDQLRRWLQEIAAG
jgi:trehalose 6-phosphate phosphatase